MTDQQTQEQHQNGNEPDDGFVLYLDGYGYTIDDLTFEEQELFQKWMREDIAPPKPCKPCRGEGVIRLDQSVELCPRCAGEGETDEARERDLVVGLITVIRRRTDPTFTIEQAKKYSPSALRRSDASAVPPT